MDLAFCTLGVLRLGLLLAFSALASCLILWKTLSKSLHFNLPTSRDQTKEMQGTSKMRIGANF